jgi:hypothetical protein
MTAKEVLHAADAAKKADRALTSEEFAAIRAAIGDPDTDPVVRGGLRELGTVLERQATERIRRQQAAEMEAVGRERQRLLDEREQHWRELSDVAAAVYVAAAESRDPTLLILAKCLQRKDRGKAPNTFEPEGLSEYQRLFG